MAKLGRNREIIGSQINGLSKKLEVKEFTENEAWNLITKIESTLLDEYTPKMQELGTDYLEGRCFDNAEQLKECFNKAAYVLIPTQVLYEVFIRYGIDKNKYNDKFIQFQISINNKLFEIALNSALVKYSENLI